MSFSIESASANTPIVGSYSGQSTRSRSTTKLDDVTSLTSFNPFAEEDENDQASYTFTSILSRVKNTFASSTAVAGTSSVPRDQNAAPNAPVADQRRPSYTTAPSQNSTSTTKSAVKERPFSLSTAPAQAAPPLVSLTPAQSEIPTFTLEYDPSFTRQNTSSPIYEAGEGAPFGTSIPGFPIQDDARSVRTTTSLHRAGSVSKVMRRLRGEGLSKDYWMDDENCKECYDCKSVFSAWRRKHHCRICGQIFCSRCASNIIKGTRFGQNAMIRVCNLCLEKLAKVDEDDEDDRRSVVSSVTFPAHQFGMDTLSGLGHPQSPFAASQMFGRTDEPFNLYSIAETRKVAYGSDNGSPRPATPSFPLKDDPNWGPVLDNPAPFRRALSDEGEGDQSPLDNFPSDLSITVEPTTPAELNITAPVSIPGTNFIQFPMGSPERGADSPLPNGHRLQPSGDYEMATPFIRSRVQSRIDDISPTVEPGWRTRRESTAYAQELNLASMMHLKIMLRQMLLKEQIPNINEWEETLLKLALRIARELAFVSLPYRQGEDMDVRRYVKIKKIPGGRPSDSEYVNGTVITKNVAHKQMSRLQNNPRIMLITFPLEFYRVEGQYMQFGQILRQEKEYLGNLASRIAALRPHIVLVEKTVSRLALDALVTHNIAVARNVKPSAIATIARMTQGDEFSSIDKLALEPRLGHCARFQIQTFDHPLIPGRRKTYMRFEGCNGDLGCTIVLRGGDIEILRRIKKVTRFLTFIVRNLKLETHLWKDSVISLPLLNPEAIPPVLSKSLGRLDINAGSLLFHPASLSASRIATPVSVTPVASSDSSQDRSDDLDADLDLPNEDAEQLRLSRRIDQLLEPYRTTFISVSATLRFPPPYPIKKMKQLDDELQAAKRAWEDDVVLKEEKAQNASSQKSVPVVIELTPTEDFDRADINAQIEALNVPIPPSPGLASPQAMVDEGSYFAGAVPVTSGNETSTVLQLLVEEPRESIKTAADIALEGKYHLLRWRHEEHRRIWEWYLRKNADDFVVEKYQQIFLWEYTIPTSEIGQRRACFAPQLTYVQFYGENDLTLGQFIEKAVVENLSQLLDSKAICEGKGCDQPLARHCKVYVHNETRLFVAVEQWEGQIVNRTFGPAPDLITTWSACRVCGSATPFIPVSPEMTRYSFAKFLELHFYPADVKLVQGAGCEHNIYQHHIRYFALRGMTVRFQTDPVVMHEIVYPPFRIHVRPETQLEIRNADFEKLHRSNFTWYSNLIDELRFISIDAATGDEESDAKLNAEVNVFISRAEAEREEISRLINKTYRESAANDTLALNRVHAFRQDKIVALQQDFDRLPKPKLATVVDRGSKRASAFSSVKHMWVPQNQKLSFGLPSDHSLTSVFNSETEEGPLVKKRPDPDPFASSASDVSEPEVEPVEPPAPKLEKPMEISTGEKPEEPSTTTVSDAPEVSIRSDGDSDSTIGAHRNDAPIDGLPKVSIGESPAISETTTSRVSRLPRRSVNPPSVAELVKKYQDFIPAQTMPDLAKSALAPQAVMSESEQEGPTTIQRRHVRRGRHSGMTRKPSTSDFESSYAANVAPIYLMHSRRSANTGSRIPGPSGQMSDSYESSRKASPEKRSSYLKGKEVRFSRPSSPPNQTGKFSLAPKQPKTRVSSRAKDKSTSRPPGTPGKTTLRRPPGPNTKVMAMAKNFERLGRETERNKGRYKIIRGKPARPVASARATVEILDSVKDALRDDLDSDPSSEADDEGGDVEEEPPFVPPVSTPPQGPLQESTSAPPSLETPERIEAAPPAATVPVTAPPPSTFPDHPSEESPSSHAPVTVPPERISLPSSPLFPPRLDVMTPPTSDLEIPSHTGAGSIFKALSEFWQPQRHSTELDDPMSDPEHIFRDSSMIVRTDEPTSIIALALNSPQHRDMLAKSRAEKKTAREPKLTEGEVFMPDDKSIAESTSTWGVVNVDSVDSADPTEELRLPSSRLPWAISFESGGLTISCTILYPEQFDALRRTYDCEKSMIESLSRCVKWNASGGKSGSAFLKTRDDRFIAKELSKFEVQTMETFAPAYFDYMSSAVSANRPTLLAKVFGCYKLTFRKTGKGQGPGKPKATQMNLLVMENLFCNRRFTKIYDLKGSTRNRHVQSTGRENEVLLDENLVETAHLNPFYLREHSKRILRGALYNDSKFLADINVMDYSLVCGVDSQNNELVVGIVDYIRTYTWDKKLESWVKEWGAGKEPTIVTPKQYRQRFISAMERYFPLIPDRWVKQRDTPEEDSNILSELWPDW